MKTFTKYLGLCGMTMLSAALQAQTITFETKDYKTLGVYDTWEQSPFRTGALEGNVAVVYNHLADGSTNPSEKILGVQRSRLGSNTFGVRIDLNETFELTQQVKYCHVMIHKPTDGRVMLIGLGKRANRPEQSNDVEQFWAYPVNDVKVGEWFDAVFPIKGNGGIDIYSLVLVPDCEAPHTLSTDFIAYIDDIVINDSLSPRFGLGDYPVNFSPSSGWGRDDRKITALNFNGGADGNQVINITDAERKGYMELFDTPFKAKAGNTITPVFGYEGSWVHGYVYLDKDRDGQFSYGVNASDILDTTTDLVSYSYYRSSESGNGKNSAGSSISNANVLDTPAFTIPSNLQPGIYRMRYKIDWNCIDAGGNIAAGNNILENGGGCFDVLLNIHEDQVSVTQDNRNGEVLIASTGLTINGDRVPFGQDLKIRMNPSNGFEYSGIRVRHGYNLTGDSIVKSNPQYRDIYYSSDLFGADDTFTIPGSVIDGEVLIEGLFVEQGSVKRTPVTYNVVLDGVIVATNTYNVTPGSNYPAFNIDTEASEEYYSLSSVPEGKVGEEEEVIVLTLTQNLPFETCTEIDEDTPWYTLSLTDDRHPLRHNSAQSYIDLSSTSVPAANDYSAHWAFMGNVIEGFKIVNRAAGEGYVLSSSTAVTSTNDGSVYPVMTSEPVPEVNNLYWMPTKSAHINGGFFLHQLGKTSNRMNKRDGRLAYWVGGADAGSTFTVSALDDVLPAIDYCTPAPVSGRSVSGAITNRTDRYLSNIVISDGTSSLTIEGGGTNSGRQVYVDRTASVFSTEPGKEVTITTTGTGFWVNTFLYVDFDLDGFTVSDCLFNNFEAGVCNLPGGLTITFNVPEGTPSGYYRARFIHDWENTDPCYYGQSGSDNGELAMDFYIKVTAYGEYTTIVSGNGHVEAWSKIDAATGMPKTGAVQYAHGDKVALSDNSQLGVIIVPDVDAATGASYAVTAVVIENGDEELSYDSDTESFIVLNTDDPSQPYYNALAIRLKPVVGNVNVSAIFATELSSITDLLMNSGEPVTIYTLQGVEVSSENVTPGFYILRQGGNTYKAYISK